MNTHFIQVDAENVKASIADLLAAYPELAEDETLFLDTLEGETDLFRILSKALAKRSEAEGMVIAISSQESDLSSRKARFKRQSDAMKKLIKGLLDATGQTKLTLPEATLSITQGRASVNVTDVDQLPQGYFTTVRQADKKALSDALLAGQSIPGAELALGNEGLTIRTK